MKVAILVLSSCLSGVGLYASSELVYDDNLTTLGKMRALTGVEDVIEWFLLILGWICMTRFQNFAPLRCFRVFRVFSYLKPYMVERPAEYDATRNVLSFTRIIELALQYFSGIATELLSQKSRGGLFVLGLFFFQCYVVAVVSHTTSSDLSPVNEFSGTQYSTFQALCTELLCTHALYCYIELSYSDLFLFIEYSHTALYRSIFILYCIVRQNHIYCVMYITYCSVREYL